MVSSVPDTLDTLKELADALGNDANFATTVATQIGQKADTTYVDNQMTTKADLVHTHTSNHISAMTGYNKGATTPADVLDTDSLNIAIAKLENKIDNKTGAYKLTRLSNSVTLVGNANSVTIGVAFDSGKDILNVYLSGVRLTPDVDYTATNTTITGIGGTTFISGDVVSFEVIKIEVI